MYSFELESFPLAHVLLFDPTLTGLTSTSNQLVLVVFVQLGSAHLLDSRLPELVLDEQLNSQVLIWDFAERVLSKLAVASITEYLAHRRIRNRRVLHLHDLDDLWPVLRFSISADSDCKVDLFVEVEGAFEIL